MERTIARFPLLLLLLHHHHYHHHYHHHQYHKHFNPYSMTMKKLPRLEVVLSPLTPDLIAVGPGNYTMPEYFADWYPSYASLAVQPDDVWVVTYPKAGEERQIRGHILRVLDF